MPLQQPGPQQPGPQQPGPQQPGPQQRGPQQPGPQEPDPQEPDPQEPEDSGIDSDDVSRRLFPLSSEGSSSDEDPDGKGWWLQILNLNDEILTIAMDEKRQVVHDVIPWRPYNDVPKAELGSPDRSFTPIYEVELTASDEEDDASMLELVIPIPASRYQRVPTSSPRKHKPKVLKRWIYSMLCCVRK